MAKSYRSLKAEILEDRRLLAILTFSGGSMSIVGDSSDEILEFGAANGYLKIEGSVTVNSSSSPNFALSSISNLIVETRGGDDLVLMDDVFASDYQM